MNELPSYDEFKRLENSEFIIYFDEQTPVSARLDEVSELKKERSREAFSLVFTVGLDAPVLQNTFKVEHPELESFGLFLVPIGRTPTEIEYEAVFHRFMSPE
jgi:hypothetical protein